MPLSSFAHLITETALGEAVAVQTVDAGLADLQELLLPGLGGLVDEGALDHLGPVLQKVSGLGAGGGVDVYSGGAVNREPGGEGLQVLDGVGCPHGGLDVAVRVKRGLVVVPELQDRRDEAGVPVSGEGEAQVVQVPGLALDLDRGGLDAVVKLHELLEVGLVEHVGSGGGRGSDDVIEAEGLLVVAVGGE